MQNNENAMLILIIIVGKTFKLINIVINFKYERYEQTPGCGHHKGDSIIVSLAFKIDRIRDWGSYTVLLSASYCDE